MAAGDITLLTVRGSAASSSSTKVGWSAMRRYAAPRRRRSREAAPPCSVATLATTASMAPDEVIALADPGAPAEEAISVGESLATRLASLSASFRTFWGAAASG